MFYLRQFFKISLHYPIKSTLFLLMTLILTITFLHGYSFRVWFWDYYGKLPFYPSFYAMYSTSENVDYIRSKLMSLPNIVKVEFKEKSEIEKNILKNFNEMGLPSDLASFEFNIIRIYLEKSTSPKTFNLLKEYLQRLVKDKNIIVTNITEEKNLEIVYKNDFMDILKKMGMTPLYLISFVLWFLSFFIWLPDMRKFSYILENYQRREFVLSKLFLTGISLILAIVLIPSLIIVKKIETNILFVSIFYLLIGTIISRVKYEFSEKN